jgi:excisionase family DNA binding protein
MTDDGPAPLFVSVAEAARRLGLSTSYAYRLVAEGEIPSRKFGRLVRVPVKCLEALAAPGPQPMDDSFT